MAQIGKPTFKRTPTLSQPSAGVVVPATGLSLPTEKHKPSNNLTDYSFLIYGERKIGKTTLISMFDDVLFLCFEPGARATETYQVAITDWPTFLGYTGLLKTEPGRFRMHCLDTGGIAYDMAMDFACQKHGFDHPGGQNDYGASWNKVKKEFVSPLRWLLNCGTPMVVIAHEQEKEIETRSGRKFIKMRPQFSGQADDFFTGQIDNVFYYYFDHEQRWLQIEGDEYITAGHRIEGHFITPSGERIFKIPMGNSKAEAYGNLIEAFNNKQAESFYPKGGEVNEPKVSLPPGASFKK